MENIINGSIIATVFASIMSLLSIRSKSNLKYVTEERKIWREQIREIAEKLHVSNNKKTLEILVKLKVRLNAYGQCEQSYAKDSHIWELIKELENTKLIHNDFESKKKQIIDYLSLLVKHDWDRSKKEVYGNIAEKLGIVFLAMHIISLFLFNYIRDGKLLFGKSLWYSMYLIGLFIVIVFICFVPVMFAEVKKVHKWKTILLLWFVQFIVITIFAEMDYLFINFSNRAFNANAIKGEENFLLVLFVLSVSFISLEFVTGIKKQINYYLAIEEIKKLYQSKSGINP